MGTFRSETEETTVVVLCCKYRLCFSLLFLLRKYQEVEDFDYLAIVLLIGFEKPERSKLFFLKDLFSENDETAKGGAKGCWICIQRSPF